MKTLASVFFTTSLITAAISSTPEANAVVNIEPECSVNLNGNLRVSSDLIEITTDENDEILFTDDQNVYVNGTKLSLTRSQQKEALNYYNAIQTALPMTIDIASDGVAIASDAITQVIGGLLGEDDPFIEDSNEFFDDINTSIDSHFYDSSGAFIIKGSDVSSDGWITSEWENTLSARIESLMERAMGRMIISLGKMLISGDEDAQEKLDRLDSLDENIDAIIEDKADRLEAKADALCEVLIEADEAENALQSSSVDLANLNIFFVRD